jgi:protein arginine N-methyltransferase 2
VQETVRRMCVDHPDAEMGLRVLNVGFGLGIVSVQHDIGAAQS